MNGIHDTNSLYELVEIFNLNNLGKSISNKFRSSKYRWVYEFLKHLFAASIILMLMTCVPYFHEWNVIVKVIFIVLSIPFSVWVHNELYRARQDSGKFDELLMKLLGVLTFDDTCAEITSNCMYTMRYENQRLLPVGLHNVEHLPVSINTVAIVECELDNTQYALFYKDKADDTSFSVTAIRLDSLNSSYQKNEATKQTRICLWGNTTQQLNCRFFLAGLPEENTTFLNDLSYLNKTVEKHSTHH